MLNSIPALSSQVLQYRISDAVPYAKVVHDKMVSDPGYFVRWRGPPPLSANGSICQNYLSACFNDPHRINDPVHNCPFEIRAAAYNISRPEVQDWVLEQVSRPKACTSLGTAHYMLIVSFPFGFTVYFGKFHGRPEDLVRYLV